MTVRYGEGRATACTVRFGLKSAGTKESPRGGIPASDGDSTRWWCRFVRFDIARTEHSRNLNQHFTLAGRTRRRCPGSSGLRLWPATSQSANWNRTSNALPSAGVPGESSVRKNPSLEHTRNIVFCAARTIRDFLKCRSRFPHSTDSNKFRDERHVSPL